MYCIPIGQQQRTHKHTKYDILIGVGLAVESALQTLLDYTETAHSLTLTHITSLSFLYILLFTLHSFEHLFRMKYLFVNVSSPIVLWSARTQANQMFAGRFIQYRLSTLQAHCTRRLFTSLHLMWLVETARRT